MARPTKIALVYDAIYPFVKGGAERRFYEIGKRLAGVGYDVHWYGMKFWDGPSVREHDGITLHGICKARPLYVRGGRRSIAQALLFGAAAFKLLFADYDVIDCCGFPYFSLFPARLSASLRRKPLFATWHEVWGKEYWKSYLGPLGIIGYLVELLASKLPDNIIATSQQTADLLRSSCRVRNVSVLPNGVDTALIDTLAPSKQAADLMYTGRLVESKNVQLIIEALHELQQRDMTLRCHIIGDGPARSDLQALARHLHVDRQIIWHGFIEKSETVYALMLASKIFVLPSEREGFGIVAIEAFACGLPVLTADYPANAARQLVDSGKTGYVLEPNAESFTDAIIRTLSRMEDMSTAGRQAARSYDWTALAQQQTDLYQLQEEAFRTAVSQA